MGNNLKWNITVLYDISRQRKWKYPKESSGTLVC